MRNYRNLKSCHLNAAPSDGAFIMTAIAGSNKNCSLMEAYINGSTAYSVPRSNYMCIPTTNIFYRNTSHSEWWEARIFQIFESKLSGYKKEQIGKLIPTKIFVLHLFTIKVQKATYNYRDKIKLHDVVISLVDEPQKIVLQTSHGATIF